MKKLSKAQLEMLKRFGTGDQLRRHHFGPDIWYTWPRDWHSKTNSNTVDALYRRGLIQDVDPDPFETSYAITQKGRDYLVELEP